MKKWKFSYSAKDINHHLNLGVEYVYGARVKGDIAEFGTGWGVTAECIAEAMSGYNNENHQKNLLLFDSFLGLPSTDSIIDIESPYIKSGIWKPGSCKGISKKELTLRCKEFLPEEEIYIYDGWFKDTLPQIDSTGLALIHVDCDLYSSTIDVLDFVFGNKLVQEGSAIYFDDWNCNQASNNHGERKAWEEIASKYMILFEDWGSYGWAGKKFIVQSYDLSA